jgi:hypothetical protein
MPAVERRSLLRVCPVRNTGTSQYEESRGPKPRALVLVLRFWHRLSIGCGNRPATKHEHDTRLLVPRRSLVTSPSPAIKLGLDLKAGVYQSLDDDFSRSFGVKNLGRVVGAAEKVGQNLLRGELGRGALRSGKSKA